MEWALVWRLVESVSNWFYEPLVFWSVPLGLALMAETARRFAGRSPAAAADHR
jgi:hypothetical protein